MAYNKRQKLSDNIAALRVAFAAAGGQQVSEEDRDLLKRFSGFGGLKFILNPCDKVEDKSRWTQSDQPYFDATRELFQLIRDNSKDEAEYLKYVRSVRSSILSAFYTPMSVINAISGALKNAGVEVHTMLDPSSGKGSFVESFLSERPGMEVTAFEKDLLTGKVLQALYSYADVHVDGYETIDKRFGGHFDVAASNIPFGDISVFDPSFTMSDDDVRRHAAKAIHNYFFLKTLDNVREGGIVAFITSQGVMDSPRNKEIRQAMMERAYLVGAVRLPNNMFSDEAGTDVGSDLIILQKDSMKQRSYTAFSPEERAFVDNINDLSDSLDDLGLEPEQIEGYRQANPNAYIFCSEYLWDSDSAYLGEHSFGKDQYGKFAIVSHFDGSMEELGKQLQERLDGFMKYEFNKELYQEHALKVQEPVKAVESHRGSEQAVNDGVKNTSVQQPVKQGAKQKVSQQASAPVQLDFFAIWDEQEEQRLSMEPRSYSGEILSHYRDGVIIIDNDQIGVLSNVGMGTIFKPLTLTEDVLSRLRYYIPVRDAYQQLYAFEAEQHVEQKELREKLNRVYDSFIMRYGSLNDKKNFKAITSDILGKDMLCIENNVDGKFIKSDIFDRPVSFNANELDHVENALDALSASLNRSGGVDLDYMGEISGKSNDELLSELRERIFFNPDNGEYEVRDKFLAGNVIEKIDFFENNYGKEHLETMDDEITRSYHALLEVRPRQIPFAELDFNFGERWMPNEYFEDFASELFDVKVDIQYAANLDEFVVTSEGSSEKIRSEFAVHNENGDVTDGLQMLRFALYNTVPTIQKVVGYKPNGDPIKGPDHERMQLAASKIDAIRDAFAEWINGHEQSWKDDLADMYNRKFNCFVRPEYDGTHQTFPDLDFKSLKAKKKIESAYDSQKNAVWMILQNGGGICDHEVGTGKTLIMCMAAHEMKRLGMAHKPIIIGMKANVSEIAATYQAAYPNARVLYASEKDYDTAHRVEFFNRAKNNDYDVIIMSHDQFGMIPQSAEIQRDVLEEELYALDEALDVYEQQGYKVSGRMKSGLQKRKENLEAKLQEINYALSRRQDDIVDFKTMGIDHIFVDESQAFKNLPFTTRDSRVAGLGDPEGSKRARNLMYAIRTIQQQTGRDLGATFLSGTTISNSLTELYLLFKYLRPQALAAQDIHSFDAWAAVFATKTRDYEINVAGQVVMKERFRKFIKVPELGAFYNEITDYKTAADVGLERPEMNAKLVNISPTADHNDISKRLLDFANSGNPEYIFRDNLSDNEMQAKMLIVTNLGKKASLSPKLVNEDLYSESDDTKLGVAAKNISEYYEKYKEYRGTQFVFCDLSTPKKGQWTAYQELKDRLVQQYGIPEDEIYFMQDAGSEKKREKIIEKMNRGEIRVLFGSTTTLGTGVNAQERCVAIHHLDLPWRPSDMEQRNGRGVRKGNEVARLYADNKVDVLIYAVERSLDSYNFYLLQAKSDFIRQMKTGALGKRDFDMGSEDEENGMNFQEYVAITSGNTDLLDRAKLEKKVLALEAERKAFNKERSSQEAKLSCTRSDLEKYERYIEHFHKDFETIVGIDKATFSDDPEEVEHAVTSLQSDGYGMDYMYVSQYEFTNKRSVDALATAYGVQKMVNGSEFVVLRGEALGAYLQSLARVEVDGEVMIGSIDRNPVKAWITMESVHQFNSKTGVNSYVGNKFYVKGEELKYTWNEGKVNLRDKKEASLYITRAIGRIPGLIEYYQENIISKQKQVQDLKEILKKSWPKADDLSTLKKQLQDLDRKIQQEIENDNILNNHGQVAEELPYKIEQKSYGREPWELTFQVKDYPFIGRADRERIEEELHGSIRVYDGMFKGSFRHQYGAEQAIKELSHLNAIHRDDKEFLMSMAKDIYEDACLPSVIRLKELGFDRHGNPLTGYNARTMNVMALGDYQDVRDLAHGVKDNAESVIYIAAEALAKAVNAMDDKDKYVLVAMPTSGDRYRTYTDRLCSRLSTLTGLEYANCLEGVEHDSLYDWKKEHPGEKLPELFFSVRGHNRIPEGKTALIIDNVIDTGHTAMAALDAMEHDPVMLVLGATGNHVNYYKNVEVTIVENGMKYVEESLPEGVGLTGKSQQEIDKLLTDARSGEWGSYFEASKNLDRIGIDWYTGQPKYVVHDFVKRWDDADNTTLSEPLKALLEKGSVEALFTEEELGKLTEREKQLMKACLDFFEGKKDNDYRFDRRQQRQLLIVYDYLKDKVTPKVEIQEVQGEALDEQQVVELEQHVRDIEADVHALKKDNVEETASEEIEIITPKDSEERGNILSVETVKSGDNTHVGFSVVISDGEEQGVEHLVKSVFYDGKMIGSILADIETGKGNPFRMLRDDAVKEICLLNVLVHSYDSHDDAWEGVADRELDGYYDYGCIRFENEEDMIRFYEANRQEVDYRNERYDKIESVYATDGRTSAEVLSLQLPVSYAESLMSIDKQRNLDTDEAFIVNHSQEERERLRYVEGEFFEDYLKRNLLDRRDSESLLYFHDKYSEEQWLEIDHIFRAGMTKDNAHETGEKISALNYVSSKQEGYSLMGLLRHVQPDAILPYLDGVSAAFNKLGPERSELKKQYDTLKEKHPDALLLFRGGDFYETYEKDAKTASDILGITITWSDNDKAHNLETYEDAMAAFPHHALDTYLPKLVRAGQRVAICDLLEDPKNLVSNVKRDITMLVDRHTDVRLQVVGNEEDLKHVLPHDAMLRDALIERLRAAGIPVVTDAAVAEDVLMNGNLVREHKAEDRQIFYERMAKIQEEYSSLIEVLPVRYKNAEKAFNDYRMELTGKYGDDFNNKITEEEDVRLSTLQGEMWKLEPEIDGYDSIAFRMLAESHGWNFMIGFDYYGGELRIKDQLAAEYALGVRQPMDDKQRQAVEQTDGFKQWFGDWKNDAERASKVIGSDGRPMVLYHGTGVENAFSIFDRAKAGRSNDMAAIGFWFTPSSDFAQRWTEEVWYAGRMGGYAIPVYLDIKNPKVYRPLGEEQKAESERLLEQLRDVRAEMKEIHDKYNYVNYGYKDIEAFHIGCRNGFVYNPSDNYSNYYSPEAAERQREYYATRTENGRQAIEDGERYYQLSEQERMLEDNYNSLAFGDSYEQFKIDFYVHAGMRPGDACIGGLGMALRDPQKARETFRDYLKSQGYDGIIIEDTKYDRRMAGTEANTQYIVFEPEQIKSAIENNGEFLRENPDIRYFRNGDHEVYGFVNNGTIYVDPRIATAETPIHEYTHLWAEVLRVNNRDEWKNIVQMMKDTPEVWNEVRRLYPWIKDENQIAEEALARYSGHRGYERLMALVDDEPGNRNILDKMLKALDKFWHAVADFLHIHYTSKEQVADQIMHDLLSGVKPLDYNITLEDNLTVPVSKERQIESEAFRQWFGDWQVDALITEKDVRVEPVADYDNADLGGAGLQFRVISDGKVIGFIPLEGYFDFKTNSPDFLGKKEVSVVNYGFGAEIKPEYRHKGFGKAAYLAVAKELAASGNVLCSADTKNMSDDAKGLWSSLEKEGLVSFSGNRYSFKNDRLFVSKVVDDNGKPLVVEHGTNAEFTFFDANKIGYNSKDNGLFGAGFYFGTKAPAWLDDNKGSIQRAIKLHEVPELRDIFAKAEPTKEDVTVLSRWLKAHKDDSIVLYHGTDSSLPILQEGLKRTSMRTKRSLQSGTGNVYLTPYPGFAKAFGGFAYPEHEDSIAVYDVAVKVKDLHADKDQLKNKRMVGIDLGDSLAASMLVGHSATVKHNIENYDLQLHNTYHVMRVYLDIKRPFEITESVKDIYTEIKEKLDTSAMRGLTLTGLNGKQMMVGEYIDVIKVVDDLIEYNPVAVNSQIAHDEELQVYHPKDRLQMWREHEISRISGMGTLPMSWQAVISEQIGSHQFTAAAIQDGYDGVIVTRSEDYKEYVAFEPSQIKSATDNIGLYSKQDNDIRYHIVEEKTERRVLTAEEREVGGAVVDQLGKMGISVHTDNRENRRVLKEAQKDQSEVGKVRYMKTSDGESYGFAYKGEVYLDLRKIDGELPLHEYAHLWCQAIRRVNPAGWENITDIIKADNDTMTFVRSNYPELTDDNDMIEEVIAHYSGKRGAEKLHAELQRMMDKDDVYSSRWGNIYQNISKSIQDFWKHIGDSLNIRYVSKEDIADQILNDFARQVNPVEKMERWLVERDKEYAAAVEAGDIDKARDMFWDALHENVGNGITPFIAVDGYRGKLDQLAHAVKELDNADAINKAAEMMAPFVRAGMVLVPAPGHEGYASSTLALANAIAERSFVPVADVLKSDPRESQYEYKYAHDGKAMPADALGIRLEGELPADRLPVVIDNVVHSGNTAEACIKALGGGVVLALASAVSQEKHVASLKSLAPVVYDKDGKLIPLSERFELKGRYLGRPMLYKPLEKGEIHGLENYDEKEILKYVREHFEVLREQYDFDAEIIDMRVIGSRVVGNHDENSDLDVLLEYKGKASEDGLFNILNDDEDQLFIEGIPVDINPITVAKSGTIAEFLARNADYDKAIDKSYKYNNDNNMAKTVLTIEVNGRGSDIYHTMRDVSGGGNAVLADNIRFVGFDDECRVAVSLHGDVTRKEEGLREITFPDERTMALFVQKILGWNHMRSINDTTMLAGSFAYEHLSHVMEGAYELTRVHGQQNAFAEQLLQLWSGDRSSLGDQSIKQFFLEKFLYLNDGEHKAFRDEWNALSAMCNNHLRELAWMSAYVMDDSMIDSLFRVVPSLDKEEQKEGIVINKPMQYAVSYGSWGGVNGLWHVDFGRNINAVSFKEKQSMAAALGGEARTTYEHEWADFDDKDKAVLFAERVVTANQECLFAHQEQFNKTINGMAPIFAVPANEHVDFRYGTHGVKRDSGNADFDRQMSVFLNQYHRDHKEKGNYIYHYTFGFLFFEQKEALAFAEAYRQFAEDNGFKDVYEKLCFITKKQKFFDQVLGGPKPAEFQLVQKRLAEGTYLCETGRDFASEVHYPDDAQKVWLKYAMKQQELLDMVQAAGKEGEIRRLPVAIGEALWYKVENNTIELYETLSDASEGMSPIFPIWKEYKDFDNTVDIISRDIRPAAKMHLMDSQAVVMTKQSILNDIYYFTDGNLMQEYTARYISHADDISELLNREIGGHTISYYYAESLKHVAEKNGYENFEQLLENFDDLPEVSEEEKEIEDVILEENKELVEKRKVSVPLTDEEYREVSVMGSIIYHMQAAGISVYLDRDLTFAKTTSDERVRQMLNEGGKAYGIVRDDGVIFVDPNVATAETPIHEYTHLWAEVLRQQNPDEWKNIVMMMRDIPLWNEVKEKYPNLYRSDDIAEEVLAHYSGKRGHERLLQSFGLKEGDSVSSLPEEKRTLFDKISEVIARFWSSVADFLHIHYTSKEQVADQILKDIVNHVNPLDFRKVMPDKIINGMARAHFIGEKGAKNIAKSRMSFLPDMLVQAKRYDAEGMDAVRIKMITGWEKGVDDKWRYEVSNTRVKSMVIDDDTVLSNVIYAPDLFAAYPEMANIKVRVGGTSERAVYNHETHTITLNNYYRQHETPREEFESVMKKNEGEIKDVEEKIAAGENEAFNKSKLQELENTRAFINGQIASARSIDQIWPDINAVFDHETQHIIQDIEGFARGGSLRTVADMRLAEAQKLVDKFEPYYEQYKELEYLVTHEEDTSVALSYMYEKESFEKEHGPEITAYLAAKLQRDNAELDIVSGMLSERNIREYNNLAGEVEARNVMARRDMSIMERRKSLASSTEDVSREEQIVTHKGISASMVDEKVFDQILDDNKDVLERMKNNPIDHSQDKGYHINIGTDNRPGGVEGEYHLQFTKEISYVKFEEMMQMAHDMGGSARIMNGNEWVDFYREDDAVKFGDKVIALNADRIVAERELASKERREQLRILLGDVIGTHGQAIEIRPTDIDSHTKVLFLMNNNGTILYDGQKDGRPVTNLILDIDSLSVAGAQFLMNSINSVNTSAVKEPVREKELFSIDDILSHDDKFRYMLLSRLESDVKYYLGNGNRYAPDLWAKEESRHIDLMYRLWDSFKEKPEWLTREQIDVYAKQMGVGREMDGQKENLVNDVHQLIKEAGLEYSALTPRIPVTVTMVNDEGIEEKKIFSHAMVSKNDIEVFEDRYDAYDGRNGYKLSELPLDGQTEVLRVIKEQYGDLDRQVTVHIDKQEVPEYALSAIVNGDFSGIDSEEDSKNIREFMERKFYKGAEFIPREESASFTSRPAFGLATDCVTVDIVRFAIIRELREEQKQISKDLPFPEVFEDAPELREAKEHLGNVTREELLKRVVEKISLDNQAYSPEEQAIVRDAVTVMLEKYNIDYYQSKVMIPEMVKTYDISDRQELETVVASVVYDIQDDALRRDPDILKSYLPVDMSREDEIGRMATEAVNYAERIVDYRVNKLHDVVSEKVEDINKTVAEYNRLSSTKDPSFSLTKHIQSYDLTVQGENELALVDGVERNFVTSWMGARELLAHIDTLKQKMKEQFPELKVSKEEKVQDATVSESKQEESKPAEKKSSKWENFDYSRCRLPEGIKLDRKEVFIDRTGPKAKYFLIAEGYGKSFKQSMYPNDIKAYYLKDDYGRKTPKCTIDQLVAKYFGKQFAEAMSIGSVSEAEHVLSEQKEEKVNVIKDKEQKVQVHAESEKSRDAEEAANKKAEEAKRREKKEKVPAIILQASLLSCALAASEQHDGFFLNLSGKQSPVLYHDDQAVSAFNALMMGLHADANGYKSYVYTTYDSSKADGCHVKGGESGLPFNWYQWDKYISKFNAHDVITKEAYDQLDPQMKELYSILRTKEERSVFNIDQTNMSEAKADDYKSLISSVLPVCSVSVSGSVDMKQLIVQSEMKKQEYPDKILLMRHNSQYEVFGSDAADMAKVIDIPVEEVDYDGKAVQKVSVPVDTLEAVLPKVVDAGYHVLFFDDVAEQLSVKGTVSSDEIYRKCDQLVAALEKTDQNVQVNPTFDTQYDVKEGVLRVNNERSVVSGEEMKIALDRINDTYRACVGYTGAEQRLSRSASVMTLPADRQRYEFLVQNLAAGVMMMREGLPAKLSADVINDIPFWQRELKESPKMLESIESDVNHAVQVLENIRDDVEVDYSSLRENKSFEALGEQSYSIASEIANSTDIETKKVVLVKDTKHNSAAVILPSGASLEVNNELAGMNKNGYVIALRKEGFDDVRFFNAGGVLGLNQPNEFFADKEVVTAQLKDYTIHEIDGLDFSQELARNGKVDIEQVTITLDDNNNPVLFVKPSEREAFTVYADRNDLNLFVESMKTQNFDAVRESLGQKYYDLVKKYPNLKREILVPNTEGIDLSRITSVNITKDRAKDNTTIILVAIDGEQQAPVQLSKGQAQHLWLADDIDKYKVSLAAQLFKDKLGIDQGHSEDGQVQFRDDHEGQHVSTDEVSSEEAKEVHEETVEGKRGLGL